MVRPPSLQRRLAAFQNPAFYKAQAMRLPVWNKPRIIGGAENYPQHIGRRKVSTLVLVHRTEPLRQWQERLTGLLEFPKGSLGVIGGGKKKPSGKIDIAVMQSLSRREDLGELLDQYGQIIIDECHLLSAISFEAILKQAKAKFVVGLTATPTRREGHQPIIFMQCGPIRQMHQDRKPLRRSWKSGRR